MTKRSKSVFAGRPDAWIVMSSAVPADTTLTRAVAPGRQAFAPADTTMSNEISLFFGLALPSWAVAGLPATRTSPRAHAAVVNTCLFIVSPSFLSRCPGSNAGNFDVPQVTDTGSQPGAPSGPIR